MGKKSKRSLIHFNGGEWSPKVDARVDHQKYPAACRQLVNMIPTPHGAVTRRKGLRFIAETKDSGVANLIRFQFSRTESFALEFGDLYVRFYRDGLQVESGGSPYEVVSPYAASEVFDMKFAQINDVVFITHANHPPQILSRIADDNWTLVEVDFDYPALMDDNVDTAFKLQLSAVKGTGVTMNATGHTPFTLDHIGSYWKVGHYNDEEINQNLAAFAAGAVSPAVFVQGTFTVETTGVWTATQLEIEQSTDSAFTAPTVVRTLSGNQDKNYNIQLTSLADGAYYRFKNGSGTSTTSNGGGDDRARIKPDDAVRNGIVKVTAFGSSSSVTVDVLRNVLNTDATEIWAEGAWSSERGFPKAINFFENRILYAGTTFQPQTVWGSVTDDYYNFEQGDEDTDSYAFTLASPERNEIIWIGATTRLIIGTTGGEWMASGNDVDTSITPTSIIVRQHGANGVDQIRPLLMEGRLVYMQRGGRKLRGMEYDGVEERFKAEDLTVLSDHLTAGRVISMAYQAQRDSLLWAVTGNGNLICLTYEPDQGVMAWSKHTTKGNFECVETIYGAGDDETWVIVRRVIGGVERRYIESFRGYYNPTIDGEVTFSTLPDDLPPPTDTIDCATASNSGGIGDETYLINLGDESGTVTMSYDSYTIPDRFTIYYEDQVISSGFVGSSIYDSDLIAAGYPPTDGLDQGAGTLQFEKGESSVALVRVEAPLGGTSWQFTMGCPDGAGAPSGGGDDDGTFWDLSETDTEERFVDSAVTYTAPATVFTGLDHLEGETVQILADGARVADMVVASGTITLPFTASVVHIGLQYESILQPMRLDVDSQFGVLQGIEKRIYEVVLRLMDTGSVRIKTDEAAEWDYVREVVENQGYGDAIDLFTGETGANILTTGHNTDPTFILSCNDPLPFTLIAAILKYTVTGDQ